MELPDGSLAVGLFNTASRARTVRIGWEELGVTGARRVRDLWRRADQGEYTNGFEAEIDPHGTELILLA